jgi:DNA-binding CsgD family transcriptional regulator
MSDRLTAQEQQIATRLLAGLTHKEIGAQLFLSPKTIEYHVGKMRRRLGAGNRSDLFAKLRAAMNRDTAV